MISQHAKIQHNVCIQLELRFDSAGIEVRAACREMFRLRRFKAAVGGLHNLHHDDVMLQALER